jgi:hypothetical protein
MTDPKNDKPAKPWWRHGFVWMVLGGPAVVVVASVVTAVIAATGADQLVDAEAYRRGAEISRQLRSERALLPANQARNHAATPTREEP